MTTNSTKYLRRSNELPRKQTNTLTLFSGILEHGSSIDSIDIAVEEVGIDNIRAMST